MNPLLARRQFLGLATGAVAGALLEPRILGAAPPQHVSAIAFDAFPIFDPRPVFALTEELFPGKGAALSNAWRTRQFEYTWIRTAAGRYADFCQITRDALVFAARTVKVDLTSTTRARLMDAYLNLEPWDDVPDALRSLKAAGIRLAILSNFSHSMLSTITKNAGLDHAFEFLLSTDDVKQFKPAPRAYQMAVDAFGLNRDSIVFTAFASWDAVGAKWFGYPTVWVNRLDATTEELSVAPNVTCSDLAGLLTFVRSQPTATTK